MTFLSSAVTRMFALMGKKTTPEIIFEWSRFLSKQNLPQNVVLEACMQAVNDPEVDPYRFTVAKLLAYVKPVEDDPKALALEEWEKVVSYVSSGKSRQGIPEDWEQRTVSAFTSVGGLFAIGDADSNKLSYIRNSFIKAYADYSGIYKNREKQMLIEGNSNPMIEATIEKLCESTDASSK